MSAPLVDILELIAWDLDLYRYRDEDLGLDHHRLADKVHLAQHALSMRPPYIPADARMPELAARIDHLLAATYQRNDLHAEYTGLNWTLGVIDLHALLAFQRRLIFGPAYAHPAVPSPEDWPALISLTFAPPRETAHRVVRRSPLTNRLLTAWSHNPDLQLRMLPSDDSNTITWSYFGGNPFLEAAELHGRWFLRDGYHRAYRLLRDGVRYVPAVIIHARNIEELGATSSSFFGQEQLFSERPPLVSDFLLDDMTVGYRRVALRKVLRLHLEESLEPFNQQDEHNDLQGEPYEYRNQTW